MSYDTFKPALFLSSRQTSAQLAELDKGIVAEIEKEIAWNEQRLTNLVWGEADRQQTEDYIEDLRQERQRLLEVLGKGRVD